MDWCHTCATAVLTILAVNFFGIVQAGILEIGPACLASSAELPLKCEGQLIIHRTLVTFNSACGGACGGTPVVNPPDFDQCWTNMTQSSLTDMMSSHCEQSMGDNAWSGCTTELRDGAAQTAAPELQPISCRGQTLCANYLKMQVECIAPPTTAPPSAAGDSTLTTDEIYYIIGMVGVLGFVTIILLATCCVILYRKRQANRGAELCRDNLRAANLTQAHGASYLNSLANFPPLSESITIKQSQQVNMPKGHTMLPSSPDNSHYYQQPVVYIGGSDNGGSDNRGRPLTAHSSSSLYQGTPAQTYDLSLLARMNRAPQSVGISPPLPRERAPAVPRADSVDTDEDYYQQIPDLGAEGEGVGVHATNHALVLGEDSFGSGQLPFERASESRGSSPKAIGGTSEEDRLSAISGRSSGIGSMKGTAPHRQETARVAASHEPYTTLQRMGEERPNPYLALDRPPSGQAS